MIKWIKPNGNEIETNGLPKTVAHCESLGWERADAEPSAPKTVDEMSAPELKELCKELDIEYTTKPEAVGAIKAKQAEGGE